MNKCLLSVLLTCTMLLGMNLAAYAAYEDGNGTNKNVGVSEQMPAYSENMGRSISMPSKSSLYTTGETYSVSGTASTTFSGLKNNKYYFLQFEAPSDFSGSVRGNR